MTTDVFDPPTTPIPRDRWKRPLVVPPGGGKATAYTRATTYVDCLDDKYNLQRWEQRMVALGLAERPDLLLAVAATDREDKSALDTLTSQAQEAARAHAAATTGTALHALTERYDRGQGIGPLPAAYRPDLDAYIAATDQLEHLMIERFVVHDGLKIGGTPDRVSRYRGGTYITDLKTGSIDFGFAKIAMQLAVYSRSVPYDHTTTTRTGFPEDVDQQRGIIIHLPAGEGRCALYWIDLTAGWDGVQLASQVRKWRRRSTMRSTMLTRWDSSTAVDNTVDNNGVDDTVDSPQETSMESAATVGYRDIITAIEAAKRDKSLTGVLMAITSAATLEELRRLYTRLVESGVDSEAILPTCLARKAELEGAA